MCFLKNEIFISRQIDCFFALLADYNRWAGFDGHLLEEIMKRQYRSSLNVLNLWG